MQRLQASPLPRWCYFVGAIIATTLSQAADASRLRLAKTYSGGMRRRLDLAACLVGNPRILYLDDPKTGLDPRSRADVWVMIRGPIADGVTVLLTTQYLEEADHLAHDIIVDHGKVVATGTPDELKARAGGQVLLRPAGGARVPAQDLTGRRAVEHLRRGVLQVSARARPTCPVAAGTTDRSAGSGRHGCPSCRPERATQAPMRIICHCSGMIWVVRGRYTRSRRARQDVVRQRGGQARGRLSLLTRRMRR